MTMRGVATALAMVLTGPAFAAPPSTPLAAPVKMTEVTHYAPKGKPAALVIFLSGDGGWEAGVVEMAELLANEGAEVVAIDTPKFLAALDASAPTGCGDLAGAVATFAAAERKTYGIADDAPLVLAGFSSGATLSYLGHAAMPKGAVTGSIGLGFCPDMENKRPLCVTGGAADLTVTKGKASYLYGPALTGLPGFVALQGMQDEVCNPQATVAFGAQIPGAKVIQLPKVGHGFGVDKNWVPQYLAAYREIVAAKPETSK
jgi:type IV secretory pathway VirJ component